MELPGAFCMGLAINVANKLCLRAACLNVLLNKNT